MSQGASPERRAAPRFSIEVEEEAGGWRFAIREGIGEPRRYRLNCDFSQADFATMHDAVTKDFGLHLPKRGALAAPWPDDLDIRPLLTRSVHSHILYGYGDPAVLRVEGNGAAAYVLTVTSNDAPNAFPILRSHDARHWDFAGAVFADGETPPWVAVGPGRADFWAPEIHRVGDRYWLCFTARKRDGGLAIGLATADSPFGPFTAADGPLLEGEVIDAHLFVDPTLGCYLVWKEDRNGLWPSLLLDCIARDMGAASLLFPQDAAWRTADFYRALEPWIARLRGMPRFFALHPLIEAVTVDLDAFTEGLVVLQRERSTLAPLARRIAHALTTPIRAQPINGEGTALVGTPSTILRNDQPWEAHLVEGPWIHHQDGTYYLFYAGNDFSTERYGIGCAVATAPLGPYRKQDAPFLQSTRVWLGPGHPSIARGPDAAPYLFFHAYHPGVTGYGAFRALLCARLELAPDRVAIGRRAVADR